MNNENKIIDKIIADANQKAEEILAQARLEADEKLKAYEIQAKKETDISMETAQSEAVKAKAKEISSADMTAKKRILSAKQNLIEKAIEQAKEKLLNEKNNEQTILDMLKNIKMDSSMEIIMSLKDVIRFKSAIDKAGYKLSEQTRDITGGFILKSGDIEYNYSFESIIAVEKEDLEQLAAQILLN